MKRRLVLAFIASLFTSMVYAQNDYSVSSTPADDCQEAITVFQDVSGMGRKDRAAKNMTKRHAEMAGLGWRFEDMEIYTENGDLEGFYLTYTRSASCESTAQTSN